MENLETNNLEELEEKEYKLYIENKIKEFNENGKKTIVHFCDTYYPIIDGVIKVMENYAVRQAEKYNIILIVPKHKGKTVKSDKYLVIGVTSMYFKFVNYDLAFPKADSYLNKVIKTIKIDIIHSHSTFNMGTYASNLAKKLRIPLVMTMHSQYKPDFYKHTKSMAITNLMIKNVAKVYNTCTELWTMHQKVADVVIEYGYKGKIYFMPNATDYIPLSKEDVEKGAKFINEKYNIKDDENVFLFVGRIVEQKNLKLILDSLNLLKERNINFKMFFVGDGPDKTMFENYVNEIGLSDNVIFTGMIKERKELSYYYQRSDLFLFPSTYDTSSLVQIEAATFFTPGVFIEETATAATITDRHNGFLSKETVEDYANTIEEAISDKNKLSIISQNAHKELYVSWDTIANRTMDRYEYLIERNKNKLKKLETIKQTKKDKKD